MVCMFSGRKQFTTQITCIKLECTDFKNFTYNFISLRYILARAIREKASAAVSAFAKDKSEPAAKRAKKAENRLIQIQNWIGMISHKMSIIETDAKKNITGPLASDLFFTLPVSVDSVSR